jgi:hypothetical protein
VNAVASAAWVVVLGAAAAALAGIALWTRRPFFSALALGGAGVFVFALLLLADTPGLAVAALACTWAVSASGLVVGSALSAIERAAGLPDRRGPWALALFASALLTGSLALGVFAVDWPAAPSARAGSAAAGVASAFALGDWMLAACAAAGALSLAALAPAPDEEP